MDSFVVLPAAGASNGFSTPSNSVAFFPTSAPSIQSTLTVEADVPRSCPGHASTSSTSVVSQSSAPVAHRHPADDMTSTGNVRAQLFRDRQQVAWNQMRDRMERRRREWDAQVDRMRTDFFKLKPPTSSADDAAVVTADRCQQRVVNVEPSWAPTTITRQQFQV